MLLASGLTITAIRFSFDIEYDMTIQIPKGGAGVKRLGKYFLTSSLISNLIYHYLPLPLKKLVFMAIVIEVVHGSHNVRRRQNKLLLQVLSDIHSKQIAPSYTTQVPKTLETKSAQIQLADFFYRSIPSCFRYASYRSVKHDIIDSLNKCPQFHTQYA